MPLDQTLAAEKTPEQLEAARVQAEADLALWYQQSVQLKALKESEMELRNKVVQYYFPLGLKEGTNKADLPEGWKLDVKGTINRKVDEAVISAVMSEMADKFQIDAGEFIKYKPELDLPAYRQLVDNVVIFGDPVQGEAQERAKAREQAKLILATFEQLLIITDGSPQVSLVAPKKPKAKVSAV